MSHFPPPPPLPRQVRRFQRVPPAVFPPILGLFGLGMAWRRGADAFGMPIGAVELFLGATSLIFLFAATSYLAKIKQRPGVVPEDLGTVPGRGGLAAATMCTMLLAATLVPYWPDGASAILWAGLAGHAGIIALVTRLHLAAPPEGRRLTPAMHLVYVGVIVAPFALLPLGQGEVARWIVWYALVAAAVVTPLSIGGLLTGRAPVPLRPLQAIHLAPAALTATAAFGAGLDTLGLAMLGWACAVAALLLVRLRWMIAGGFSGFWSSFTFPLAAFAGAWFAADRVFGWGAARPVGGIVLIAATLVIPPIAVRVMTAWADGTLAAKTNAATA